MFQRRKRNLDLSGAKEQIRNGQSTHGINWDRTQSREKGKTIESTDNRGVGCVWEEADEETVIEPECENLRQHPPKAQSVLAFSERQNVKNADFGQPTPSYPGLQKRPDFYEHHKKMTIYVDRELMKMMENLKKERYIPSYSWLVAEAVRFYLQEQEHRK
ncbi:CopG family transcriptional regulator [Brevibacillus fluminis]|uniref:ribbon-helix-helix domain-containing protein n=1 Tax=Brevibacillus fluminis TaxID=511487 RepID=UPI003F8AD42C